MTAPLLLIAEREFRAYVATLSFWVALAVGPVAMASLLALVAVGSAPATRVSIRADSPATRASAAEAVREAAELDGRDLVLLPSGDQAGSVTLDVERAPNGLLSADVTKLPLSPSAQAFVLRTIERDDGGSLLRQPVGPTEDLRSVQATAEGRVAERNRLAPAMGRFGIVGMLWLTLTGSLGMLLQAVVRERGNRSLESLLACARPWEIVVGKVVGVGAVSLLVLSVWLTSAAALSPFTAGSAHFFRAIIGGLSDPVALGRAALIYLLAFGFYGTVTVAVGAAARDSAQAQNLSRPMFAVLLAAFFAALVSIGGGALAWLVYLPPFTPFMLLLASPGELSFGDQTFAIALLATSTLAAGALATRRLDMASNSTRSRAA